MKVRLTRFAVVAIALAVFSAGCGKYSISNIRSAKAFQDANSHYSKQEYAAAVPYYEASIKHNPDLGYPYFFLGHSHDQLFKPAKKDDPKNIEHLQEAAKYYRLAVEKLKDAKDEKEQQVRRYAYEYLIAVYGESKLNDFPKAEAATRELIALDPKDGSTHRILGKLYEDQGRFDEAEQAFNAAIAAEPNAPIGYQMLAGYYERRGDFPKTINAYIKRAEIEPRNPEAWHTIGAYYQLKLMSDKRLPRAQALDLALKGIAAEDKALSLSADYIEAITYKNILLRQQALYETSPAKQKELLEEADRLFKRQNELRKKQEGAPTPTPTGTPPAGKGK
jgi:tetratricopeptide (TPR) repeat protein